MADYPPTPSFGTGYGQPNPPYAPGQYMQPRDEHQGRGQFAPQQSSSLPAYGYNQTIPMFGAPAVQPGPPLSVFQTWNQDTNAQQQPPYHHQGFQYSSYTDISQGNPHIQRPSEHSYHPEDAPVIPVEEGEIREGEFEDPATRRQPGLVDYSQRADVAAYPASAKQAIYVGNTRQNPHDHTRSGRSSMDILRDEAYFW